MPFRASVLYVAAGGEPFPEAWLKGGGCPVMLPEHGAQSWWYCEPPDEGCGRRKNGAGGGSMCLKGHLGHLGNIT